MNWFEILFSISVNINKEINKYNLCRYYDEDIGDQLIKLIDPELYVSERNNHGNDIICKICTVTDIYSKYISNKGRIALIQDPYSIYRASISSSTK